MVRTVATARTWPGQSFQPAPAEMNFMLHFPFALWSLSCFSLPFNRVILQNDITASSQTTQPTLNTAKRRRFTPKYLAGFIFILPHVLFTFPLCEFVGSAAVSGFTGTSSFQSTRHTNTTRQHNVFVGLFGSLESNCSALFCSE